MNIVEKQVELTKSLYEINTETLRALAEFERENVEKYFAMNREFGERLPEIREINSFMDLQREYGETLWNATREAVEGRTEILTKAFESSRTALETAFTAEEAPVEAAKPKAKAKAKPKAKKAAPKADAAEA